MRTITKISSEIRQGARAVSVESEDVTFFGCLEAVRNMNGDDRSLVCVELSDGSIMIGGGGASFIVTMEFVDKIVNAVDLSKDSDDFVEMTVGGQAVDYPSTYVISFEQVCAVLSEQLDGGAKIVEYEVVPK